MGRVVLIGMVVALLAAACGGSADEGPRVVPLTASDTGTIIEVEVGDEIEITLEGNPTTGYTWMNESPATSAVVEVGEPEFTPESDLIGAPGIMTCRFEAVEPGAAQIELAYRRPWEPNVDPERLFRVTIAVEEH